MKKANRYVAIDIEATGLNPKLERIIEIGAVKVVDGEIVEEYQQLVDPKRKLEDRIIEITGIKDEDLKEKPVIGQIIGDFLEFVGDDCILGHSIMFDYAFLKRAAVNGGFTFDKNGIDTLKIARNYFPKMENKRLGYLCEQFQIPIKAHRALEDAKATAMLYEELCKRCEEVGRESDFLPKTLIYKVKKESPITEAQKNRLYFLLSKHKLTVDFIIDNMTRNEASRYTDKIISLYGR